MPKNPAMNAYTECVMVFGWKCNKRFWKNVESDSEDINNNLFIHMWYTLKMLSKENKFTSFDYEWRIFFNKKNQASATNVNKYNKNSDSNKLRPGILICLQLKSPLHNCFQVFFLFSFYYFFVFFFDLFLFWVLLIIRSHSQLHS